MTPELKRILADLLSGLSVPGSLGILGEADKPWLRLRHYFGVHGYPSPEEIERLIDARSAQDQNPNELTRPEKHP